jgi:hypothetical protein
MTNTDAHLASEQDKAMSNQGKDAIMDKIADNEMDLMYQYMESDPNWKRFIDWLYENEQDNILEALFQHFLSNAKGHYKEHFDEWCIKTISEDFGNEDDPREER